MAGKMNKLFDTKSILCRGTELITIGDTYLTFVWFSAKPELTQLALHQPSSSKTREFNGPISGYHRVDISKLSLGSIYHYKLLRDRAFIQGKITTLTPPGKTRLFRFAILADTHAGFPGRKNYFVKEAVQEINNWKVAFAIVAGDCAHHGLERELRQAYQLLSHLNCPFYMVPGNHEDANPKTPELYTHLMKRSKSYFSFWYKEHLFICLDSSSGKGGGGLIEPEQFEWLQAELERSHNRPVFILLHHFCNIDNCQPFNPTINNWRFHGIRYRLPFQKLLAKYPNVAGAFSGHAHLNSVTTSPITGKIPYVALPSTVDYPCGYVLVDVYDKGYMKTFHMLQDTEEQYRRLVERAAEMQNFYAHQALGTRAERNFVYLYSQSGGSAGRKEISKCTD